MTEVQIEGACVPETLHGGDMPIIQKQPFGLLYECKINLSCVSAISNSGVYLFLNLTFSN